MGRIEMSNALGMVETLGNMGAVEIPDATAKAAEVTLAGKINVDGGIVTTFVGGDVAAAKAATDTDSTAVKNVSTLRYVRIISRPDAEIEKIVPHTDA
jgi:ethanolamine utilization protein EutM